MFVRPTGRLTLLVYLTSIYSGLLVASAWGEYEECTRPDQRPPCGDGVRGYCSVNKGGKPGGFIAYHAQVGTTYYRNFFRKRNRPFIAKNALVCGGKVEDSARVETQAEIYDGAIIRNGSVVESGSVVGDSEFKASRTGPQEAVICSQTKGLDIEKALSSIGINDVTCLICLEDHELGDRVAKSTGCDCKLGYCSPECSAGVSALQLEYCPGCRKYIKSTLRVSDPLRVPSELNQALIAGDWHQARILAATRPELVDIPDNNGNTPLHWAAKQGSLELLYILLNKDSASLFKKNNLNQTPLQIAADYREIRYLKAMIEKLKEQEQFRADSPFFKQLVRSAQQKNHPDVLEYLRSEGVFVPPVLRVQSVYLSGVEQQFFERENAHWKNAWADPDGVVWGDEEKEADGSSKVESWELAFRMCLDLNPEMSDAEKARLVQVALAGEFQGLEHGYFLPPSSYPYGLFERFGTYYITDKEGTEGFKIPKDGSYLRPQWFPNPKGRFWTSTVDGNYVEIYETGQGAFARVPWSHYVKLKVRCALAP